MKKTLLFMGLLAGFFAFAQPGAIDPSFGINGYAILNSMGGALGDEYVKMAVQADGKIVCAGQTRYSDPPTVSNAIFVTRFNSNGSLDNTFIPVVTAVGNINDADINDIVIQGDGKIIITGTCRNPDPPGPTSHSDIYVFRCNSNGGLDATFANGGKFIYNIGYPGTPTATSQEHAFSSAVSTNGEIFISGYGYFEDVPFAQPFVLKMNSNGTINTSYGTNGFAVFNFIDFYPNLNAIYQTFNKIFIQQDGKIVTAGKVGQYYTDFGIARLNTDGTPDSSFGNAGRALFTGPFLDGTTNFLIQNDGKYLLSGKGTSEGLLYHKIVRLLSDGSPDLGFGINGIADINVSPNINRGNIALQSDGKIIAIDNSALTLENSLRDLVLTRLNTDGSPDTSFALNGTYNLELSQFDYCIPYQLTVQPDGKIVAGLIFDYSSTPSQVGLMRFNGGEGTAKLQEQIMRQIMIYPNPATNILNISNPENIVLHSASILDITGKTVLQQTGNPEQVDIQNLSPGMYFLNMKTGQVTHQHKFIKQ